ncbi:hypothetical protein pb186bvf_015565 [Paramecium bursaria]
MSNIQFMGEEKNCQLYWISNNLGNNNLFNRNYYIQDVIRTISDALISIIITNKYILREIRMIWYIKSSRINKICDKYEADIIKTDIKQNKLLLSIINAHNDQIKHQIMRNGSFDRCINIFNGSIVNLKIYKQNAHQCKNTQITEKQQNYGWSIIKIKYYLKLMNYMIKIIFSIFDDFMRIIYQLFANNNKKCMMRISNEYSRLNNYNVKTWSLFD